MKILYGVQGTGHGHLVRSASLVRQLRERGHEVHCLLTGREPSAVPDVGRFAPYTALRGFTGYARGGRLRIVESALGLRIPRFFQNVREFDATGFELVVTDYEPVAGWIARRHRLPSIGLGHLYAFAQSLGLGWRARPAQVLVGSFARLYTPVQRAIGLHWHPFGGTCLPPTIPPEVRSAPEVRDDRVVVYLPGESEASISALFHRFERTRFAVYRPVAEPVEIGNVVLRPHDRECFLADLAEASGVITNAGFSLPSEALHLGRRLLVKPIRRHPEQFLNGLALEALGLGTVAARLSPEVVEAWLDSPMPAPMNYPDVTRLLVDWIDRGNWDRTDELVEDAWNEVSWSPR